jgi:hypothetical protein
MKFPSLLGGSCVIPALQMRSSVRVYRAGLASPFWKGGRGIPEIRGGVGVRVTYDSMEMF